RTLVTGANGLIGCNVVRALLNAGYPVRAFVRSTSDISTLSDLPIEVFQGDVLDASSVSTAAKECDVIYHCAALFSYGSEFADLESVAVRGTVNVLQAARRRHVRRVVFTSSSVIFGYENRPRSRDELAGLSPEDEQEPYVTSKIRQEKCARLVAKR